MSWFPRVPRPHLCLIARFLGMKVDRAGMPVMIRTGGLCGRLTASMIRRSASSASNHRTSLVHLSVSRSL